MPLGGSSVFMWGPGGCLGCSRADLTPIPRGWPLVAVALPQQAIKPSCCGMCMCLHQLTRAAAVGSGSAGDRTAGGGGRCAVAMSGGVVSLAAVLGNARTIPRNGQFSLWKENGCLPCMAECGLYRFLGSGDDAR